jgi:hypothetical protein
MSSLRSRLADLADRFAADVLAAIRTASLDELTGPASPARRGPGRPRAVVPPAGPKLTKGGRLARRSDEDIAKTLGLVVAALKAGPLRAEELKAKLGIDKRELPRVLADGLKAKKIAKKGRKRATVYSAR